MKRIMSLRSLLFLLMQIAMGMGLISCSIDEVDEPQAVDVSLKTLNENGELTSVFKNEDNIYFDLSVNNNTNDTIFINERYFLEEVLSSFKLYSSSGAFVGYPFSGIELVKFRDMANNMKPHESRHWQCVYTTHPSETAPNSPFKSDTVREPFPKGDYYLLYSLTLSNVTKTGKVEFRIK